MHNKIIDLNEQYRPCIINRTIKNVNKNKILKFKFKIQINIFFLLLNKKNFKIIK